MTKIGALEILESFLGLIFKACNLETSEFIFLKFALTQRIE